MSKLSEMGQSVMNLFSAAGGATPVGGAPVASGVQAPGTNIPAPADPSGRAPGSGEPTGKVDGAGNAVVDKTPLADFADLFTMPVVDEKNKPQPVISPLDFDPTKLMEVAGKLDFTQGIDPALIEKAKGGDQQAMLQVMNASGQRAFAQAVHSLGGITKRALAQQAEEIGKTMPEAVRASVTAASLKEANPLYSSPAFAPIVSTLESQLRVKHPDATPAQITDHVNKYLDGVATMFKSGKAPTEGSGKGPKGKAGTDEVDWGEYFSA